MKVRDLFAFGNTSEKRRTGVSRYLIKCSDKALKCSPIDFGVPADGGFRIAKRQNWIFKKGWSRCDGYEVLSNHQLTDENGEGQALDLVPYIKGKGLSYEAFGRFGIIGTLMLEAWEELQEAGEIPKDLFLHWGGFWKSRDGIKLGWDLAHFEIRKYEQKIRL
jgi:hypothetical protein